MKRTLFTMAVALVSAASFAQETGSLVLENPMLKKVKMSDFKAVEMNRVGIDEATNQVKKSAATGNYYRRPEGSMFLDMDTDGMSYYQLILNTTAFTDAVFTNMNANPSSTTWYLGTIDVSQYGMVDENYNFVWSNVPSEGLAYAPTLVSGSDSYTIPNASYPDYGSVLGSLPMVLSMTYTPGNYGATINGYSGFTSTAYLFGTAEVDMSEAGDGSMMCTATGVRQHFEKPMTPLYVEGIHSLIVAGHGKEAFQNGATLTMTITGDSGNVLATLTAGADNYNPFGSANLTEYGGTYTYGTLAFSQKENDPLSGELVDVPFVIDEAFTIDVTGFENSDVNVGFFGFQPIDEDPLEPGYLVLDVNGEERTTTYGVTISVPFFFTGFMDNVFVGDVLSNGSTGESYENCNVLRISDTGEGCGYENGLATENAFLYVYTAMDFADAETENINYYYEVVNSSTGDDSWIAGWRYDNTMWGEDNYNGLVLVDFVADPIAAGEGRWAVVNIVSAHGGVVSPVPVILLQGTAQLSDVEIPSGIENVVVDNGVKANPNAPVYNLNGQRVSKDAKGVLIQNGKKFVNK